MLGWIKENGNRQLRIWTLTRRSMTSVDLALTGRGKIRGPSAPRTPVGMTQKAGSGRDDAKCHQSKMAPIVASS